MRRAVCPGSFDPVTNGHIDIVSRASGLFDEVVVAVLVNKTKRSLFTVEERIGMLEEVTGAFANVTVGSFHGLLVDYCREANMRFSVGYELTEPVRAAILGIPADAWVSALDQDGSERENGQPS